MPTTMDSSGSTVAVAGRLAVNGPAWNASWASSSPTAPTTITAYSCQLVSATHGPCTTRSVSALSSAAVAAYTTPTATPISAAASAAGLRRCANPTQASASRAPTPAATTAGNRSGPV